MIVPINNIHLFVNEVIYIANEDKSFMIGSFVNKGVVVKNGRQVLQVQPLGLKSIQEFDLLEFQDKLYYNDHRELEDICLEEEYQVVDTQDEFWEQMFHDMFRKAE